MSYKVYMVTHHDNNKRYIGITGGSLQERLRQHRVARTGALYEALRNDGHRMTMELIEEVETREEAMLKESYYIHQFNTMAPNGYNRSYGVHDYNDKFRNDVSMTIVDLSFKGLFGNCGSESSHYNEPKFDVRLELCSSGRNDNGDVIWRVLYVIYADNDRYVIGDALLKYFIGDNAINNTELQELLITQITESIRERFNAYKNCYLFSKLNDEVSQ